MRANERTDERVAQYLRLDSYLFQTTVARTEIPRQQTKDSRDRRDLLFVRGHHDLPMIFPVISNRDLPSVSAIVSSGDKTVNLVRSSLSVPLKV